MKKIFTYIFITLFILVASYTIVFPHITHAGIGDWFTIGDFAKGAIENAAGVIGNIIMILVSKILWLAGILLNYSLKWTLNISALVEQIPAITLAWKTVRDFATMFFIFLIIYQAISMILGLDGLGTKKLLVNIVIAGLLINFSLFFTKVIIDASNVIALQFYNAMTPDKTSFDGGLSDVFMQQLWIQTMLDYNQPTQLAGGAPAGIDNKNIFMTTIMGSIVMLIAAFIFFAAACLFAIRIVVLIILMALSPLAYIGGILPGTKSYADDWWNTLNKQAIFAPAYLLVTYIGIRILSDPTFKKVLNGGSDISPSFNQAFSGGVGIGASSVVVVLNFLIVIIFLIAGLIIADKLGVQGASTLKGWGNSLKKMGQGFVGRNTLGRAARGITNSETFKNVAESSGVFGRIAYQGLNTVSKAGFGGAKGGYDKALKDNQKQKVEYGKYLGKTRKDEDRLAYDKSQYVKNEKGEMVWNSAPSGKAKMYVYDKETGQALKKRGDQTLKPGSKGYDEATEYVYKTKTDAYADNLAKSRFLSNIQAAKELRKKKNALKDVKKALQEAGEIKGEEEESGEKPSK